AYELWPSLDIPMHFIGGVVTAWSGCLAYGEYAKRGLLPKLPLPFFFFCLIGLVSFVGILWECYEFIHDTFFFRGNYFQPSIRDVMGDLILDLLGGMVLFLLYSMRNKKR
ncbi:MAG TPA: hypothetical protein VEA18_02105, partial [Candidatus Kapabacteria bacterium]|nr:hypothetical protein [Candidatus Kapabacteria bacterium]